MTILDNLSPEDAIILTNAIALAIAKDKNADEINVLGNFIVGVGCLLLTVAAQKQFIATDVNPTGNSNNNSGDDIFVG
ncbi:hypothetical protein [Clostridium folliculivorans]|uniref:Uncharacterized protein n=1 Tax=Clostridium folliculivorans TaxID=2886038 RepID=A0A9W5Y0V0_9CLOT|nr:hypothetical protein [Clostridium folliculivorans]GKU24484.1 hypothetical protein CFOLD11_13100 [Clostridium folliculivorans]GKU30582.1 hypothetical protein CFB3_26890 [Clostridium folliculivorans]